MALEHVKQEIIDHAEYEAKQIIAQAKVQAKSDIEAAHEAVATFEEQVYAAQEKEKETLEKQHAAAMKMRAKRILFEKRKEILVRTYDALARKVAKLPKTAREKLLTQLFTQAKKECAIYHVYCAKADLLFVRKFVKNAQAVNILGGIIAENKDGTVRVDYSFDSMLRTLKEKNLQEVAGILFPK